MHRHGLADDEAIRNELSDGLAGVSVGDLADLIGIEPDLALSTADNGGRQTLLGGEVDPVVRRNQLQSIKHQDQLLRPTRGSGSGTRRALCSRVDSQRRAVCLHLDTDFDVVGDGRRRGLSMADVVCILDSGGGYSACA